MNALKKNTQDQIPAFSNEKFAIIVHSSNIFILKPHNGAELDVEDGYEMRSVFVQLSKGNKFAILTDASTFFSTTQELRQLLASPKFTDLRIATAIYTQNMASKIIGNFFIKVNKPASPTKLFSNKAEALKWLEQLTLSLQ